MHSLRTYDEMDFHPVSEQLVDIIMKKTNSMNPLFFRIMVAFHLTQVASHMRTKILTPDRGEVPVNMFAINLATSGFGKGHATNIIEDTVTEQFRHNFIQRTFPLLAQNNLPIISNERALRKSCDPDEELERSIKEFEDTGDLPYTFDSGTEAAIRQVRHQLLMANAGSLNLQMDEIGANLTKNIDAFNTLIELYDMGKLGSKLLKNGAENKRNATIIGRTPTNILCFGAPVALLNGGQTEDAFYGLLDMGYARRSFFGFERKHNRDTDLTAQQILDMRMDSTTSTFLEDLSDTLGDLADPAYANTRLGMSEHVALIFIEYQLQCERLGAKLSEHDDMRRAELEHRHFKALKLAGTYAFIDGSPEISEDHAYYAIKLAECSGKAFDALLTRDRPYVKLAKYLADVSRPVTQADLVEDLPFYKGSIAQKTELIQLATAHGYQNHILIKKEFVDGIEFLRGETLQSTNLNEMVVSYSQDIARNYAGEHAPFDKLHVLTQSRDKHWCNHWFSDGHRSEDAAIPGFNLIVLDIDSGVNMSTAQMLLADYKALFYTTKRNTDDDNRFRIVLPTNFTLELDAKDYKEFMNNLYQWLPFQVDTATGQRARKWLSHKGSYVYQDGLMLDVLPFIPKTSKNEAFKENVLTQTGMDNLERWVINNTGDGNRNNMLLRYAMILVDGGFDFEGVRQRVCSLNAKLPDNLDDAEIMATIMVSVSKQLGKR